MDTLSYKTVSANKNTVQKEWIVVDVKDQILGRAASKIAKMLRGKHKPSFTPHIDCGDNVIVLNADKVRLTGNKWTEREYVRHTGYPGGKRVTNPRELMQKHPTDVVTKAVKGMIPRNRLGRTIMKNLFVYTGEEHPHEAQKPKKVDLNSIK